MLWGQPIKCLLITKSHEKYSRLNLRLGVRWRLLLEEYGPKIVYIKGIHNTVAHAISRLEYDPSVNQTAEIYFMTKVNKNSKSS